MHDCQTAPDGGAARACPSVADIFRAFGDECARSLPLTAEQRRALRHIQLCHSPALGGYVDVCDACGLQRVAFHGCRDRHCPSCQALDQARWVQQRKARILAIGHFHLVFTLPEQIRPLALHNPKLIYDLLFDSASATLLELGRDPKRLGARIGITAVLHTWTRQMLLHPHLHCIVTSGGLSADNLRWVEPRSSDFLFDVHVTGKLFRGKFLHALDQAWRRQKLQLSGACAALAHAQAWASFKSLLYNLAWVVWADAPQSDDPHLIQYLGRYTHRVAISNERIIHVDGRQVTFLVRKGESCTIDAVEFVRRFLLHILPDGFTKIRHYGLYASGNVNGALARARTMLESRHSHADSPTCRAEPIASQDSDLQTPLPVTNNHEPTSSTSPSTSISQPAEDTQSQSCQSEIQRLIGIDPTACPRCHQHTVRRVALQVPQARAPPGPRIVPRP